MSRPTSDEPTDPLEREVAAALTAAGIEYVVDRNGLIEVNLDFYLPAFDVYIEVKRFHSERIGAQMARAPNVIAVQGVASVRLLSALLTRTI